MNLLKETIKFLQDHKKLETDVLWVGSLNLRCTWAEFKKLADIAYDSGYGGQEVAQDLIVVGNDWWLERNEYDGSEWWEFKKYPIKPTETGIKALTPEQRDKIDKVYCGNWSSLKELNTF